MYSVVNRTTLNGATVESTAPTFLCHAKVKVLFIQFDDGSLLGDYEIKKEVIASRAKNIDALTNLIEAYDAGGQTAFDAALNSPGMEIMEFPLKEAAAHYKIPVIELARRRLAAARKHEASGIF